jgi:hypothetical protein
MEIWVGGLKYSAEAMGLPSSFGFRKVFIFLIVFANCDCFQFINEAQTYSELIMIVFQNIYIEIISYYVQFAP